jgi:hypothetical protein
MSRETKRGPLLLRPDPADIPGPCRRATRFRAANTGASRLQRPPRGPVRPLGSCRRLVHGAAPRRLPLLLYLLLHGCCPALRLLDVISRRSAMSTLLGCWSERHGPMDVLSFL